jgi:molybdate/tungstate transport system permease protein
MTAGPDPAPRRRPGVGGIVTALAGSLLLLFLVGPVAGLVGSGGAAGIGRLGRDAELRGAILLTVFTATGAVLLAIVGGTPIAWALARRRIPARSVIAAILDLPLVIPHPVAGIALLLFLGRGHPAGNALLALGLRIVGTPLGIVAAMLFVAAPLYISGAREALERVDRRLEGVARTLGDSPWRAFRRVTLPLAARGLMASSVVMWARAVSEFGAIVVLTYNPKVVSVLSYDRFTNFGLHDALPVAAALVLLALVPLTALRVLRAGLPAEAS